MAVEGLLRQDRGPVDRRLMEAAAVDIRRAVCLRTAQHLLRLLTDIRSHLLLAVLRMEILLVMS
jgi:hypothetical protein